MKFVNIQHPEVQGIGRVTERHYLATLREKGWKLADEQPPAPADEQPAPVEPRRPQRNDSTDAWRAYAIHRGLPPEDAADMPRDGDNGLIAHIDQLDADQTLEN